MGLLANFTDNISGETWGVHAKCTYLEFRDILLMILNTKAHDRPMTLVPCNRPAPEVVSVKEVVHIITCVVVEIFTAIFSCNDHTRYAWPTIRTLRRRHQVLLIIRWLVRCMCILHIKDIWHGLLSFISITLSKAEGRKRVSELSYIWMWYLQTLQYIRKH